jgi:hypothetical protein
VQRITGEILCCGVSDFAVYNGMLFSSQWLQVLGQLSPLPCGYQWLFLWMWSWIFFYYLVLDPEYTEIFLHAPTTFLSHSA